MRAKPSQRRIVQRDGPEPVDVQVGQRLRLARILAGISQGDLGDGIGISFQDVQKYETGENRISASRLTGRRESSCNRSHISSMK